MLKTDVLIIGGGPAGSTCAWQLKKNGVDCIIIDQRDFPRFKPCAGWITPELIRELEMDPSEYPYGFDTFTSFEISIRGFRFTLPTRQHAIRRFEFDHWLLHRSGVPLQNHTAKTITRIEGGYVIDEMYFGKYLIGAGGTHCPVHRTLFQPSGPRVAESLVVAQEEEFPYPITDHRCHLWFFEKKLPGYAWYIPKANGYVNVGVGGMAGKLKANADTLKNHWDYLIQKLDATGLIRGHTFKPSGHSYYLRPKVSEVRRENAFLVGDAAGLATIDMGEGIRPAIQSGLLAAEAIVHGGDYSLLSIPKYSWPSLIFPKKIFT